MISNRQDRLLNFIITEYIKTAKPVPSAAVAKKAKLKLSSATIRNDMYALEEAGFLAQLHTSGGRVPTDRAYRYYVNQLIAKPIRSTLGAQDKKHIQTALAKAGSNPRAINKAIANVISECTGNLVITGIPQEAEFFKQGLTSLFRHPEFQEFNSLFNLASFFEGFDLMFQLVEREFYRTLGMPAGLPVQVLIGHENPFRQIRGETIMCTKYLLPGDVIGSLTLIGPTRMDYQRNIALIKYTVEQLHKRNKLNNP